MAQALAHCGISPTARDSFSKKAYLYRKHPLPLASGHLHEQTSLSFKRPFAKHRKACVYRAALTRENLTEQNTRQNQKSPETRL